MKLYLAAKVPEKVEDHFARYITNHCQEFERAEPQRIGRIHITTLFIGDRLTLQHAREVLEQSARDLPGKIQARITGKGLFMGRGGPRVLFARVDSAWLTELAYNQGRYAFARDVGPKLHLTLAKVEGSGADDGLNYAEPLGLTPDLANFEVNELALMQGGDTLHTVTL